ncbi:MAG: DUF4174 domain-containing protein [Thiohalophilus sp.]|uniref:DUF4174 domain-containing protein n=1 Tax=Thiohalophilus sp. TaxID=3028392 RepID=UPI00287059B8|nr:DUF4174 domain-containing protein [Thiohalophilus sp.]MDR9436792.1 DUF4174 domain-containing protein [Thiohalophilus sp.]
MVMQTMRHPFRRWLASALILLAQVGITSTLTAGQLSDYEWQNRPLLLFAPDSDDPRLQQTRTRLDQHRCELDDRQMILGEFVAQGQSRLAGKPVTGQTAANLRERYGIEPGQFAVILIGKDGGEKYRLYEVPELDGIFALIDGMPMRQNEMAQNPVDCGKDSP